MYVNAQNGEVVKLTDRIHEINANGTAITAYRGSRTIQTDSISPTLCLLHDHSRGQGIHTKNMQTGSDYSNAAEFTDTDNFWNNVNPEKDQYATDAHWGAAKTYDFMQQFGRNSIDNNGHPLNLFVHYGSNYVNAFWDGDKMTFGDGSGIYQPLTSLDITAHEIAHGLTQFSAGLVYAFEPGAINESFSDIFGNAVEYFADSLTYNWNIGEDIGGAFRSMSNPNSFDHPDTYLGTYWYTGSGDNGGVHTNSGVQNFWYFLLTIGGSGTNDIGNTYSVSGIGRNKANAITWRNLTVYLTSQSDYSDARFYSIQSAVDLYGSCSAEVASTTNAWYAVGVGNPYVNEVIADFTVSSNQGCNVPFNVSFNNNTANGVSYLWDFGDGQTSTNISPNHTYTSLGTYTVTLYANGGSCGLDTFISQNLISIDSTNLCTILMPDYGQAPMQTACEGRLIDDSGSDFYSDNINSSITIAPPGAAGVMLVFRQFKTEPTYDYLYVHEGYNTSGFLLEALTGSTIPDTIFVFSPAVTLRFYSDQFIVDSGFVMDWYCIQPIMQPTSFFKAKDSSSCRGYIEFSDLSTGGVDSWFWDFGDGNFSTDQNPGHLYSQPGTYTVSLIVSNSFGSDTFVKLNYINININPPPLVHDVERCDTGQVTLTSNSTNIIRWYDAANPNFPIFEGDTFQPILQTDSSWFLVEEVIPNPLEKLGPASNSIGGGSFHTGGVLRGQKLKANKICALKSAFFYSDADGFRTILLLDSTGIQLESRNIFIPNGNSRVDINFLLEKDKSYIIAVDPSFVNLYRNTSGAVYPYNTPGNLATILENTSGEAGRYYFFYDLEILQDSCFSERDSVLAIAHPYIIPTLTQNTGDTVCFGGTSKITLYPENESYIWNTGDTSNQIIVNATGSYYASVQGCGQNSDTTHLLFMPEIKTDSFIQNTSCFLGADGYIQISAENPNHFYTYLWNTTETTSTITGLTANVYYLTVTDIAGCSAQSVYNVLQPYPINITSTSTPKSCFGSNLGTISCSASGGTSPYSALWSDGDTLFNRTNVEPGIYYVTITDSKNCIKTDTVQVDSIQNIHIQATINQPMCSNSNNGSIQLITSGGIPSYSFNWSNGMSTSLAGNLNNGTYSVTITDFSGCSIDSSFTLLTIPIEYTDSLIQPKCFNAADGSIAIVTNSNYSFEWSNGSTSSYLTQITGGIYTVTISNLQNCTATETFLLNNPLEIAINETISHPNCSGDSTGSIILNINGGTGIYQTTWNDGNTSPIRTMLSNGNYSVTITDQNNCTATETFLLNNPLEIAINETISHPNCSGDSTGSIILNINGGTGIYQTNWNDGNTSPIRTMLSNGNYSVTITDQNNCTVTEDYTILPGASLILNPQLTPLNCYNGSSASIVLNPNGGTSPYNYNWFDGWGINSKTNLSAGNYSVTVSDQNGCTDSLEVIFTNPDSLIINQTIEDVRCFNENNGSISLTVNGGVFPYSYSWNNGATSNPLSNLSEGIYSVTVTDALNCPKVLYFQIVEPDSLTLNFSTINPYCAGIDNGSITALVSGGNINQYNYLWNNMDNLVTSANLAPGNYSVTVTDAKGCIVNGDTTLTEPNPLILVLSANQPSCFDSSDGTISVLVSGGSSSYYYNWSNQSTLPTLTNLSAGTYIVTVTDNNGCSVSEDTILISPEPITVDETIINLSCYNGENGSIEINANGGTGSIEYLWNTGATQNTISNLGAGSYSLTLTDNLGCSATQNYTLTEPDSIWINIITSDATDMQNNGSASAIVSGGTAPYSNIWTDINNNTVNPQNLFPGSYLLLVTDENDCVKEVPFIIGNIVDIDNKEYDLGVQIFPNPVSENLIIKHSKGAEVISILDLRGRVVFEERVLIESDYDSVNCSQISEGSYIIRVQFKESEKRMQFLVIH